MSPSHTERFCGPQKCTPTARTLPVANPEGHIHFFGGEFRRLWKDSFLSFSQFVDKLTHNDWRTVDKQHFTPQTTESFDKKILLSKIIKFYDIANIDYKYIEQLYDIQIPEYIINKKQGHERYLRIKNKDCYGKYVYDLNIDDYIDYSVDIKYFYNEEIRQKVFNFYMEDFNFFNENGIDYIKTAF